jgi:Immunity protein Imm1
MIIVTFNGTEELMYEIEEFGAALDRFDAQPIFELWLNAPGGASISMLRNGEYAFLMYLREFGDSGFVSAGEEADGSVQYTLGNGRVDEYPRSWCIPLEECYKALAYFFVNDGMRPEWFQWQES